ncbi:DUF7344 domain-containing protein [Salinigranum marinum]|uniref:DUF7344 domain-containing protein n=1 Tax=Salinigranum marinum TaxID=1515595 RepID=UPI002989D5DF|nr:hypothetical protein [Salinigranum marinum]
MARTSGSNESEDCFVSELVGSSQRQEVVWHLADNGGATGFDDLVDALSDGPERTMTAVRLHHVHLPKLAATGAVDWDPGADHVRLTSRAHRTLDGVGESELFDRAASD